MEAKHRVTSKVNGKKSWSDFESNRAKSLLVSARTDIRIYELLLPDFFLTMGEMAGATLRRGPEVHKKLPKRVWSEKFVTTQ